MKTSSSLLGRILPSSPSLLPQHHVNPSPHRTLSNVTLSQKVQNHVRDPSPWSDSLPHSTNPFPPIERAARALERSLQSLLDLQSELLAAAVAPEHGYSDKNVAVVNSMPSNVGSSFHAGGSTSSSPHLPSKRASLTSTRHALARTMQDFAALQKEQAEILDEQVEERLAALGRVEALTSKRKQLQEEISAIAGESGALSAKESREEARQLEIQIQEMEDKLAAMKARHRYLMGQAQEMENIVAAKLSSYQASLELLDREIREFLTRPPVTVRASHYENLKNIPFHETNMSETTFLSLPADRRTLEMASHDWETDCESLESWKASVAAEAAALEAGADVWKQVVDELQLSERLLKSELGKLSSRTISQGEKNNGMVRILATTDRTITALERQTQEAEQKKWNLLVCCIGAELEALKQGREILAWTSKQLGDHVEQDGQLLQERKRSHLNGQEDLIDEHSESDSPPPALLRDSDTILERTERLQVHNEEADSARSTAPLSTNANTSPAVNQASSINSAPSIEGDSSGVFLHTGERKSSDVGTKVSQNNAQVYVEDEVEHHDNDDDDYHERGEDPDPDFLVSRLPNITTNTTTTTTTTPTTTTTTANVNTSTSTSP